MGECRCYRALRLIVVPGTENPFGGYATGENIGQGPSVDGTFIQSPKHRANLRDPRWSWAGAGIARPSNGAVLVVQLFCYYRTALSRRQRAGPWS